MNQLPDTRYLIERANVSHGRSIYSMYLLQVHCKMPQAPQVTPEDIKILYINLIYNERSGLLLQDFEHTLSRLGK